MVKRLFAKDIEKFSNVGKSPWAKKVISGKVAGSANRLVEKKHLYSYFQKAILESKGNTTAAIARTMGYLKKDSQFSQGELLQIKRGLRDEGYFVPGYSIRPGEETAKDTGAKSHPDDRSQHEEIAARGREVKKEVGKELGRYVSSSRAVKKSTTASFFSSRPRF